MAEDNGKIDTLSDLTKYAKSDNSEFLANLEHIIKIIDDMEKDHNELLELFYGVIEFLPNALWVYNEDDTIYLQNTMAKETRLDPKTFPSEGGYAEIEFEGKFYIMQSAQVKNKLIISATDNTQSKRHERLISMGQMAAHLAHEIRNPIGSVSILASTLFNKVETKTKPIVLEIKRSIWRVERIVKATLLFSKGFTLNEQLFAVDDLQDELNLAIANYSHAAQIEFSYTLPHVKIRADFDLLSMVLQNMLFNAIDAIEETDDESGVVEVVYSDDGEYHVLTVTDTGKPFEDAGKLFEAFASTKTKGHGLGLTLSLQIVEAHGGSISLNEAKKGFVIKLPK